VNYHLGVPFVEKSIPQNSSITIAAPFLEANLIIFRILACNVMVQLDPQFLKKNNNSNDNSHKQYKMKYDLN
jgi:uncharacterized membrane protein